MASHVSIVHRIERGQDAIPMAESKFGPRSEHWASSAPKYTNSPSSSKKIHSPQVVVGKAVCIREHLLDEAMGCLSEAGCILPCMSGSPAAIQAHSMRVTDNSWHQIWHDTIKIFYEIIVLSRSAAVVSASVPIVVTLLVLSTSCLFCGHRPPANLANSRCLRDELVPAYLDEPLCVCSGLDCLVGTSCQGREFGCGLYPPRSVSRYRSRLHKELPSSPSCSALYLLHLPPSFAALMVDLHTSNLNVSDVEHHFSPFPYLHFVSTGGPVKTRKQASASAEKWHSFVSILSQRC